MTAGETIGDEAARGARMYGYSLSAHQTQRLTIPITSVDTKTMTITDPATALWTDEIMIFTDRAIGTRLAIGGGRARGT